MQFLPLLHFLCNRTINCNFYAILPGGKNDICQGGGEINNIKHLDRPGLSFRRELREISRKGITVGMKKEK